MSRVRPVLLALCVAVLVAAGCGGQDPGGQAPTEPAAPPATAGPPATSAAPEAPPAAVPETLDFTVRTVDGGELSGADLAGTPVAFWFWAAWCPRCAVAASHVRAVQEEYAGQVHMVGVAGLSSGDDGMRDFVEMFQLDGFPHLADDEGVVWERFGVTTQEYFVILDAAGGIVHQGPLPEDGLRDQLTALVG